MARSGVGTRASHRPALLPPCRHAQSFKPSHVSRGTPYLPWCLPQVAGGLGVDEAELSPEQLELLQEYIRIKEQEEALQAQEALLQQQVASLKNEVGGGCTTWAAGGSASAARWGRQHVNGKQGRSACRCRRPPSSAVLPRRSCLLPPALTRPAVSDLPCVLGGTKPGKPTNS